MVQVDADAARRISNFAGKYKKASFRPNTIGLILTAALSDVCLS